MRVPWVKNASVGLVVRPELPGPDLVDLVVDLHQEAVVVAVQRALAVAPLLEVAGALAAALHLGSPRHGEPGDVAAPGERADDQVEEKPDDAEAATADRHRPAGDGSAVADPEMSTDESSKRKRKPPDQGQRIRTRATGAGVAVK